MQITLSVRKTSTDDSYGELTLLEAAKLLALDPRQLVRSIGQKIKAKLFDFAHGDFTITIVNVRQQRTHFEVDGHTYFSLKDLADHLLTKIDIVTNAFDTAIVGQLTEFEIDGKLVKYETVDVDILTEKEPIVLSIDDTSAFNDDKPWTVVENVYQWKGRDSLFTLSVPMADKLFLDYSRYGLNLSTLELRLKYDIPLKLWNSLKGALQLYKESDIVSPYTRGNMSDEAYREHATKAIQLLSSNRKRAVVDEYNNYYVKKAKLLEKQVNVTAFNRELIVQELSDFLSLRSIEPVKVLINDDAKLDEITVCLSDLHVGLDVADRYNVSEYNSRVIERKLQEAADIINSYKSARVNIAFAGDLIHGFTGTMHPGMWKEMEKGRYGSAVIRLAVEIIEQFLTKIANLSSVRAIGGNHDRPNDKKETNTSGEMVDIIMFILRRSFPDTIAFDYDDYVLTWTDSNFDYIMLHGDTVSAQKSEKLFADYAPRSAAGKYTMILSGDKHTRRILYDSARFRHYIAAPLVTGDSYAVKCGFDAVSGLLILSRVGHAILSHDISLLN